jgi:hypothetical protein
MITTPEKLAAHILLALMTAIFGVHAEPLYAAAMLALHNLNGKETKQ